MTLAEADALARSVHAAMLPYCDKCKIAGSIRRRKPDDIKDVEIVCIPKWIEEPDPADLFGLQTRQRNLLHEWAVSEAARPLVRWIKPGTSEIHDWALKPDGRYWRGLLPNGAKLDVFLTDRDRWGGIYLIRTGSARFGPFVMAHAKKVGYHFESGGLIRERDGVLVPCPREIDVFTLLGLEYVEPEKRIGPEDVRRAR